MKQSNEGLICDKEIRLSNLHDFHLIYIKNRRVEEKKNARIAEIFDVSLE